MGFLMLTYTVQLEDQTPPCGLGLGTQDYCRGARRQTNPGSDLVITPLDVKQVSRRRRSTIRITMAKPQGSCKCHCSHTYFVAIETEIFTSNENTEQETLRRNIS